MANTVTFRIHAPGDALGLLREIAEGTDRAAILEAAEALRREEREERSIEPRHMHTLFQAVVRRRGPFAQRLEAELNSYYRSVDTPTSEGQAAHLEPSRRELAELFRTDVEAVLNDTRGGE